MAIMIQRVIQRYRENERQKDKEVDIKKWKDEDRVREIEVKRQRYRDTDRRGERKNLGLAFDGYKQQNPLVCTYIFFYYILRKKRF